MSALQISRTVPILSLLALAGSAMGQCGEPVATISANDKVASAALGNAISMDLNQSTNEMRAVIGNRSRFVNGQSSVGCVYLFGKVGNQWGQLGQYFADDASLGDQFGSAVAFSDPYVVVGAVGKLQKGAVYFYERFGQTWVERGEFFGANQWADMGISAAIDGTTAVVGSPGEHVDAGVTTTSGGTGYIYQRNASTGVWEQAARFYNPNSASRHAGDSFGYAVGLSGTHAIFGIPNHDMLINGNLVSNTGAAQVGYRNAQGVWNTGQLLTDPAAQPDSRFGTAVVVKGQYAAISAPGFDAPGKTNTGRVYLYKRTAESWTIEDTIEAYPVYDNAEFGARLDMFGDQLIVSGTGENRVFLFRRDASGHWAIEKRITDPEGPDSFGDAVAIYGDTSIVCDQLEDPGAVNNAGAAYVFANGQPQADMCDDARPVGFGTFLGCTDTASLDGSAICPAGIQVSPDIWYRFTSPQGGMVTINTDTSNYDTTLSVHTGCPGSSANSIACNDDVAPGTPWSKVTFVAAPNTPYTIRVSGYSGARGSVVLHIAAAGPACYVNCDGSTSAPILNVNDFICFNNKFAQGDGYANCDASTIAPVLNVNDFTCFMNRYAAGCP